jgi:RNA polymerase sigma-70 factor (ECF subfamily)
MKDEINLEELTITIKDIKDGHTFAQGKFYDLTSKAIYRFAFLLSKNEQQALDLCHDTFIKAFTNLHKLKDNKLALAWLYQIARHTFLDYKKKKKEEQLKDHEEEQVLSSNNDHQWIQIRQVLGLLTEEERTLIILIDLEGFSYHEASEVLGVSEDSIRMKIFRARERFLEIYK